MEDWRLPFFKKLLPAAKLLTRCTLFGFKWPVYDPVHVISLPSPILGNIRDLKIHRFRIRVK